MFSARRLMVINICVKFHENMSSGLKVMERTRTLLTHTHTQKKNQKRRKLYTPMAYFVCRGYNKGAIGMTMSFLKLAIVSLALKQQH